MGRNMTNDYGFLCEVRIVIKNCAVVSCCFCKFARIRMYLLDALISLSRNVLQASDILFAKSCLVQHHDDWPGHLRSAVSASCKSQKTRNQVCHGRFFHFSCFWEGTKDAQRLLYSTWAKQIGIEIRKFLLVSKIYNPSLWSLWTVINLGPIFRILKFQQW